MEAHIETVRIQKTLLYFPDQTHANHKSMYYNINTTNNNNQQKEKSS